MRSLNNYSLDYPPLISYIIPSYNNEEYIYNAVQSALSQIYSPLEIIISDDCSTDRTYEIILSCLGNYKGNHAIKVLKNERNLGLVSHINKILTFTSGEIIVFAAGDDISHPERTSRISRIFKLNPLVTLVHSSVLEIDSFGEIVKLRKPKIYNDGDILSYAKSFSLYIGATGAFRKNILLKFGIIHEKNTYEDLIFGFRSALVGQLYFIDHPLVLYRIDNGLSSEQKRINISRYEARKKILALQSATLRQRLIDSRVIYQNVKNLLVDTLLYELAKVEAHYELHISPKKFLRNAAKKYKNIYNCFGFQIQVFHGIF
jgi:glycosyltransferase involved in cell wall biosynthesis